MIECLNQGGLVSGGASMRRTGISAGPRHGALAVLLGASLWGAAPAQAQQQDQPTAAQDSGPLQPIIVSARKRDENLAQVPESITVFTPATLRDYDIRSFEDYATQTPDLAFTYGQGPGGIADARTISIRGITGQNLFGTAGATGFYIDDTPVPESVDPRVLDLAGIEVLKGPQGTLFGESSLGGTVRLITRKPDLTESGLGYGADGGITSGGGSADYGANLIGNVVVVPGAAALRVVLFEDHDAGYLTRTYPTAPNGPGASDPFADVPRTSVGDQGATTSGGGSAALRVSPASNLDITLRLMFQNSYDHGFPATYAPLPQFTPDYTLNRAFDVQPHASDSWTLPTLDFKYTGEGWTAVWANSYFYRHTDDVEDSSYGTQQLLTGFLYNVIGLPAQPYLWQGFHNLDQVASEARISFDPIHNLSGTFGLYYANAHTRFTVPPVEAQGLTSATVGGLQAWPDDELWQQSNPGTQQDKSIFGELYYRFFRRWTLTLGAREYWLNQSADYTANGFLNFGPTPSAPQTNSQSGLDPKFALSVQPSDETMVYASASKGFRAGGAQPLLPFCAEPALPIEDITHLESDTLWTYELGTKVQLPSVLISAAAYNIEWTNPQQQVGLPCLFSLEVNGGKARINGGELEASGRLAPGLEFRLGLGYENTSIIDPGALASVGVQPDSRIAGVPAFTASAGGVYTHPLSSATDGFVSADYSYQGNSVSLLAGGSGSQATRPGYSLVNLRFGVDQGPSELSLNFHNLLNAKPNLGDIGYIGYAQYNLAGQVIPQVATLQPLTVTLQYTRSF
jgi:iron complex outermembrane recepter protein